MSNPFLPPVLPGMAELCQLPATRLAARHRLLREYLAGRNDRAEVLDAICNRLNAQGRITDETRAHVTDPRRPFRRMVLRGAMIALGLRLPAWLYESDETHAANREWRAQYLASTKTRAAAA